MTWSATDAIAWACSSRLRNVAVIGATDNPASVGRTVLWNLISSPFGGAVFPINPKRSSVLGIRAYPNIGSIPEPADLAVIVTPARVVPRSSPTAWLPESAAP